MNNLERYDSWFATNEKNILTNPKIIVGNEVKYFNEPLQVWVHIINKQKGIVIFKKLVVWNDGKESEWQYFWDYFMDANCFVI